MLSRIAACPGCGTSRLAWMTSEVRCTGCGRCFAREGDYVDFAGDSTQDEIVQTALGTWGDDLHAEPALVTVHNTQLHEQFGQLWQERMRGAVLEIGCGSGSDTVDLAGKAEIARLYSFDIGRNVARLARLNRDGRISFFRANALHIPVRDGVIDAAYSFGVFHHTTDPARCMREANRVLARGGALFLYVYSAHENNAFKRLGVLAESLLMKAIKRLSRPWRVRFCVALSPPMWMLFSLPARLLSLCGLEGAARALPMHWGTGPFSLVPDLKDRLLAPVNRRYSRAQLSEALANAGFFNARVIGTPSGLYAYAEKAPPE